MGAGRLVAGAAVLAMLLVGVPTASAGTGDGATQAYPALGLAETSGMAASALHDGVLWVVEDGNLDQSLPPVVHAYDRSGAEVATITLAGWNNRDVEALSIGPGPSLWVADIGDNSLLRESVVVHTFPEPADLGVETLEPVSYRLRYPEGARDSETVLLDPVTGRLYVGTKSIFGGGSLYVAPVTLEPGATHDLTLVSGIPSLVSDGTFTPDGRQLVLLVVSGLGSTEARVFDVARGDDGTVTDLTEVDTLDLPRQEQAESITVAPDGTAVLVGSEGIDEPVWSVPIAAPTEVETTGASVPPATSPSAASSSPAASADGDECRFDNPRPCLSEPLGWLAAAAIALVALMATALFVLRRST